MPDNGLTKFSLHRTDEAQVPTLSEIDGELERADHVRGLTFEPATLDPETVARRYLNQMIASPAVPALTAGGREGPATEYRIIGTETAPLTNTTIVKFSQHRYRIPVYGSLITVELDTDNSFLSINSALGDPDRVDPVAAISPAQAVDVIRDDAGDEALPLAEMPRLYFYFDNRTEPHRWRLVYIAKDVLRRTNANGNARTGETSAALPELVDYIIDAHSGELVARPTRTQTVTWTAADGDGVDGLGHTRHLRLEHDGNGNLRLRDTGRNVHTYNFRFKDVVHQEGALPGDLAANPPDPWDPGAVSAHANAAEVADFLLNTLRRNGLDGQGGPFISSVNCTYLNPDPANREWRNAAWIGTQMIYGQRAVGGSLQSYAVATDVVAHEITHGLTDRTARLEYETESGALNESCSDIFGIIISNFPCHDVNQWNWEMGEDLDASGVPLRDMSDPTKRGQPAHMNDFKRLRSGEDPANRNDWGYVHRNSGIHNKAAFNLLTAKTATDDQTFRVEEAASLFYLALTNHLSRRSGFSDSRRGIDLAARTLFRNEPPETLNEKLAAIAKSFDDVGIAT